jgi:hypothetical protein
MKKILAIILALTLCLSFLVACAPNTPICPSCTCLPYPEVGVETDPEDIEDTEDVDFELPIIPYFMAVTGEIVSFDTMSNFGWQLEVRLDVFENLEDEDYEPIIYFNLTDDTYYLFAEMFDIGDRVTGWYLAQAPMIMIYPPQYTIAILAINAPEDVVIRVDRFYSYGEFELEQMISQDETLVFTIDEDTVLVLEDGTEFEDYYRDEIGFEGRKMIVIYGVSTRSIPEFAVASKIIVLFESIEIPIGEIDGVDLEEIDMEEVEED